ncbi:MAG: dienelactone hydrolase family protein [Bdellovibrionales bacterium]|nr:dienelactone hydrolase family protein [Bdellovibrionales bacterium]
MKTFIRFSLFIFISLFTTSIYAKKIVTEVVDYKWQNKVYKGFIAKPQKVTKATPAILVVHEWWGQTDYPRRRASQLAEMGYIAMAVDMYGNGAIADHPQTAGEFTKKVMSDSKNVLGIFNAALSTLRKVKGVDANKIAAIGYCFGGSVVQEIAKQGVDLKGVVSFHGGLVTPTSVRKGQVKAQMLILNGKSDSMVSQESIDSFKKQMSAAGVKYEFINYENALHGFTNSEATAKGKKFNIPIAYNKKADIQSWQKLTSFLQRIFK